MRKDHILIIRFSALGDVAMTVPVVYSLAMTYPELRITVLSRAFARPLFADLAPNVSFMEADLKREYHGIKGLNALYRRLTAKNFTAIADFHNVLRSEYLRMRFNLDRYRVEHIDKHRTGRRQLVSSRNKQLKQQPTAFNNYADVLARLGYPVTLGFTSIFSPEGGNLNLLPSAIGAKNNFEEWIGIAPFAAHPGKVYPPERMKQVVEIIVKRHPRARIFLFGRGEMEDKYFNLWCAMFKQCTYIGRVVETMHQELILMSHLDVMVSMDSANMHLASLVNTPVVSVWGATHPYAGFMGWGQTHERVVQIDLECRPCSIYGNNPCSRGDFACMNRITPEMIADRIEFVLKKNKK